MNPRIYNLTILSKKLITGLKLFSIQLLIKYFTYCLTQNIREKLDSSYKPETS